MYGDDCKRVHIRKDKESKGPYGAGPWSEYRRERFHERARFKRPRRSPPRPRSTPVYLDPMARHREALGLNPDGINVTIQLIKAAYKCKCLEHHPDKGGSAQDFRKVQEAYDYLVLHM